MHSMSPCGARQCSTPYPTVTRPGDISPTRRESAAGWCAPEVMMDGTTPVVVARRRKHAAHHDRGGACRCLGPVGLRRGPRPRPPEPPRALRDRALAVEPDRGLPPPRAPRSPRLTASPVDTATPDPTTSATPTATAAPVTPLTDYGARARRVGLAAHGRRAVRPRCDVGRHAGLGPGRGQQRQVQQRGADRRPSPGLRALPAAAVRDGRQGDRPGPGSPAQGRHGPVEAAVRRLLRRPAHQRVARAGGVGQAVRQPAGAGPARAPERDRARPAATFDPAKVASVLVRAKKATSAADFPGC